MFWKRAGFKGREREIDLLVHAHCITSLFPSVFSLIFSLSLVFFLFFLLLCITLFFHPRFRAWQGSFYSVCHDQILPFCPLTAFVWSRRTYRPPKGSSVCHSPLPGDGRFVSFVNPPQHSFLPRCKCFLSLSLKACTQRLPLNLTSFRWSVIPTRRTFQKGLGKSYKIGLFPSPHHQTIPSYLLPLTHGPTTSYIGQVQAGGAWALRVLSFQICPKICLLLMRLLRSGVLFAQSVSPLRSFTWVILCFPTPLTSSTLLDDGSYISLAHYLVSFISCNVVLLFLP